MFGLKRSLKCDILLNLSTNLFVASLRAICSYNIDLGVQFGEKYIHELPDMRAIRTMVTYYGRARKYDETLQLLNHVKNKNYAGEVRERTLAILHPEIKEEKDNNDTGPDWTFSVSSPIKLTKKPQFFKHRFQSSSLENVEGLTPEFEAGVEAFLARRNKNK